MLQLQSTVNIAFISTEGSVLFKTVAPDEETTSRKGTAIIVYGMLY